MLFIKNLWDARLKKKLSHKYIELFAFVNLVEPQSYRLRLLFTWRIHPMFHVFLLESYLKNEAIASSSKMVLMKSEEEWEVEEVLDHRKQRGKSHYMVRWKEYPLCEDSWVNKEGMGNAHDLVRKYHKRTRYDLVTRKGKRSRLQEGDWRHLG